MNVVISIAEHELEMANRWLDWVAELGGTEGHYLYLIPASDLDISSLIPKEIAAFGSRRILIKDEESQTSDWQNTEQLRSASGPNSAFRQVAWHFYHGKLGPYFWCELDCIPTKREWLDRFEDEYKVALSKGKVFVGAHVEIESVPEHMSGNAIYVNVPELAPGLVQRTNWTPKGQSQSFELAFDIAGAREVLPKAHFTNLIQHKFRFKGFESRAEFDAVIDPNAVVFHSDKSGSIYKYLRENLSGNVGVASRRGGSDEAGLGSPPAQSILPVPVLAETKEELDTRSIRDVGEARESTKRTDDGSVGSYPKAAGIDEPERCSSGNSRGGQKLSSVHEVRSGVMTSCKTTVVNQTFTPSDELETVIAQNSVIKNGLPAMSPPWENKDDTDRDIKMLCDTLALFAKAPIYKSRVRQALREAKIIK